MQTIRSLRQPGPAHPNRIDCVRGDLHALRFTLRHGASLNEAITTPLVEAGFQCGTVTFGGAGLSPFRYVMPGPPDDPSHVAYFTAPRAPSGITRIEQANATFGWAGSKPFIHCHATWTEANGDRRGGHILPHETFIAEPADAAAWAFRTIRIEAAPDPETNFTLFQPAMTKTRATSTDATLTGATAGGGLVARIKPNQDVITAVETIAHAHGMTNAIVRGSLGSLIGASFADGAQVHTTPPRSLSETAMSTTARPP